MIPKTIEITDTPPTSPMNTTMESPNIVEGACATFEGEFIVTETVVVWDREPLVPVTVTV